MFKAQGVSALVDQLDDIINFLGTGDIKMQRLLRRQIIHLYGKDIWKTKEIMQFIKKYSPNARKKLELYKKMKRGTITMIDGGEMPQKFLKLFKLKGHMDPQSIFETQVKNIAQYSDKLRDKREDVIKKDVNKRSQHWKNKEKIDRLAHKIFVNHKTPELGVYENGKEEDRTFLTQGEYQKLFSTGLKSAKIVPNQRYTQNMFSDTTPVTPSQQQLEYAMLNKLKDFKKIKEEIDPMNKARVLGTGTIVTKELSGKSGVTIKGDSFQNVQKRKICAQNYLENHLLENGEEAIDKLLKSGLYQEFRKINGEVIKKPELLVREQIRDQLHTTSELDRLKRDKPRKKYDAEFLPPTQASVKEQVNIIFTMCDESTKMSQTMDNIIHSLNSMTTKCPVLMSDVPDVHIDRDPFKEYKSLDAKPHTMHFGSTIYRSKLNAHKNFSDLKSQQAKEMENLPHYPMHRNLHREQKRIERNKPKTKNTHSYFIHGDGNVNSKSGRERTETAETVSKVELMNTESSEWPEVSFGGGQEMRRVGSSKDYHNLPVSSSIMGTQQGGSPEQQIAKYKNKRRHKRRIIGLHRPPQSLDPTGDYDGHNGGQFSAYICSPGNGASEVLEDTMSPFRFKQSVVGNFKVTPFQSAAANASSMKISRQYRDMALMRKWTTTSSSMKSMKSMNHTHY